MKVNYLTKLVNKNRPGTFFVAHFFLFVGATWILAYSYQSCKNFTEPLKNGKSYESRDSEWNFDSYGWFRLTLMPSLWPKQLPSRELTYARLKKVLLSPGFFLFPFGGICDIVPWRVFLPQSMWYDDTFDNPAIRETHLLDATKTKHVGNEKSWVFKH